MSLGQSCRALLALYLGVTMAVLPAHGLVRLNESRDLIHVSGSVGVSGDSNVFAASNAEADLLYTSKLSVDYARRAGRIGVNASAALNLGDFTKLDDQDFRDPAYSLEFTKAGGRTTGSLLITAARESRADAAVNTRSTSWNFNYGLNYRYSLSRTYDLSGGFGYSHRAYVNNPVFADLKTYSASVDLYHVITRERDVIFGYRYRHAPSSRDTATTDHGVNVGLNGPIVAGVAGTLRLGYQVRDPKGIPGQDSYASWTAATSLAYAVNRRLNLGFLVSKDFSTTATDSSVDVLTASLDAHYSLNTRLGFNGSLGWGESRFVEVVDPLAPALITPARRDNYLTASFSTSYSLNEHLKMDLTYSWFRNWSTLAFADFVRGSWSFNLSSRW